MDRPPQAPATFRFADFELNVRARELRQSGRRIHIQDKPFDLLVLLLEHAGEIVTRDELQRRLWPSDTFVAFDDSLNAVVRKVRDALEDSAGAPRFVETVPRFGYRFVGVLDQRLGTPAETPSPSIVGSGLRSSRQRHFAFGALLLLALGVSWALVPRRGSRTDAIIRFQITTPDGIHFPFGMPRLSVSPDGHYVTFLGQTSQGDHRVWIQRLDETTARPLAGTEYAWEPAWSPDSGRLAFVSYDVLRLFDITRGTATELSRSAASLGLSWNDAGDVLYARKDGQGLDRLSSPNSVAMPATRLDAGKEETRHLQPQFLPDGQSFIFLAQSRRDEHNAIYAGRIGTAAVTRLVNSRVKARYVEPGLLLFMRGSQLLAQRFNATSLKLEGNAVEVASGVPTIEASGVAEFSVSANGVLVYGGFPRVPVRELLWLSRDGQRLSRVGGPDHDVTFNLSPDGTWAAIERTDPEIRAPDIWIMDVTTGMRLRATTNAANDERPVWSPNGREFVYARHPAINAPADLFLKNRINDRDDELFAEDGPSRHPSDWSADGRWILFDREDGAGTRDIFLLPLEGARSAVRWLATPADERMARFSPDGRWIAYEASHGSRSEIYVRAFDGTGAATPVSIDGGSNPRWRRDGGELYYVSGAHEMMAVPVHAGDTFTAHAPQRLFELRRLASQPMPPAPYDVTPDGQRFLVGALVDAGGDAPISVVLNWTRLLEQSR